MHNQVNYRFTIMDMLFLKLCLCIHLQYCTIALENNEVHQDAENTPTDRVHLHGAGASFPSGVYNEWVTSFRLKRGDYVNLDMSYEAVGSGNGIARLSGQKPEPVEYAGSDYLLPLSEEFGTGQYVPIPTMAGAVVLIFNLPCSVQTLRLSLEATVGIFNGTIKYWDDPVIKRCNRISDLPHARIITVARADRSGTTEIFTGALSKFSAEWNASYGIFSDGLNDNATGPAHWDPAVIYHFGYTSVGVAGLVLSIPNSISYVSADASLTYGLRAACLINKQGQVVAASVDSVTAAVQSAELEAARTLTLDDLLGLSNSNHPGAYPIVGYSFIVFPRVSLPCDSAIELYRYVVWYTTSNEASLSCNNSAMVSVSPRMSIGIQNYLEKHLFCEGTKQVWPLVEEQMRQEEPEDSWEIWLSAVIAMLCFLLFMTTMYAVHQRLKANRALTKAQWKIPIQEIQLETEDNDSGEPCARLARLSVTSLSMTYIMDTASSFLRNSPVKRLQGKWGGKNVVLLKTGFKQNRSLPKSTKLKLIWMRETISDNNVAQFYGLTEFEKIYYVVNDYCPRGSLYKVLHESRASLEAAVKYSLATDVARGMSYLHRLNIVHGGLSSACCFLDTKWTVKVTDWEYGVVANSLRRKDRLKRNSVEAAIEYSYSCGDKADMRFWIAPELVRYGLLSPDKSSDVYSFGIILWEIMEQSHPYQERLSSHTPDEIVAGIINCDIRPRMTILHAPDIRQLMRDSWAPSPKERPSFRRILKILTKLNSGCHDMVDYMMERLERTTVKLRAIIERRDALLHQMLPPSIANVMTRNEQVVPEAFDCVTVFFSSLVNFAPLCSMSSPVEIVTFLNGLHTAFASVISQYDVYNLEILGDIYVVISGLPKRNANYHVDSIAKMALELACLASRYKVPNKSGEKLQLRMGFHSGTVIAGVVGVKLPRYTLFGDTVVTASLMESSSYAMKIQMSKESCELLKEVGGYVVKSRGNIHIKDKYSKETFWLHGHKESLQNTPPEIQREITELSGTTTRCTQPLSG